MATVTFSSVNCNYKAHAYFTLATDPYPNGFYVYSSSDRTITDIDTSKKITIYASEVTFNSSNYGFPVYIYVNGVKYSDYLQSTSVTITPSNGMRIHLVPTAKTTTYTGSVSASSYSYDTNDKSYQGVMLFSVTISPQTGSWTLKAKHSITGTTVSKTITASGGTSLVLPYLYMGSNQTYTVTLTAPDGTEVDSIVVPCLDVPTYTLTFNANGGTGAPSALTTKGNVASVTIPATIPTRTNYKFLGWSKGASSTVLAVSVDSLPCAYSLTQSMTLYAVWKEIADIELFFWNGSDTADATLIAKGKPVTNITAARWNNLLAKISELADAVGVDFTYTAVSSGSTITAARFNVARNGLAAIKTKLGTTTVLPAEQSKGNTVYASLFVGGGSIKVALNALIGVYNNG